jgi:hypothetical protein
MRESDRDQDASSPDAPRTNPHGGHGRSAAREIAEQYTTETGHPPGGSSAAPANQMPVDMPPNTNPTLEQHSRKGQAQSPREETLNQPEKKRRKEST